MKIKPTIALTGIILLFAGSRVGAVDWEPRTVFNPEAASFDANEIRYDLFGTYGTRNRDDFTGDAVGVGIGINYFFTRHFGVGADTYLDDFDFPNHLDASFLARYPLEKISLAPYAFAGFGRQFHDVPQWTTHIGAGAEYRFNRRTGFFLDVRRVFADQTRDFDLWRFGVRFGF